MQRNENCEEKICEWKQEWAEKREERVKWKNFRASFNLQNDNSRQGANPGKNKTRPDTRLPKSRAGGQGQ